MLAMAFASCQTKNQENQQTAMEKFDKGSFGYDLNFLQGKDSVILLKNEDAQVVVSAKYQGKVFTSTADGLAGRSFGWINYDAFDQPIDPHMNAYGGENRLWLGPEGNRFSLFFKPGAEMTFENWKTPPAIDTEPWNVVSASEKKASLTKETSMVNYTGARFHLKINREISLLNDGDIEEMLGISPDETIKAVGYSTYNEIVNTGDSAWTRETGAPCIWILDMFMPSPSTVIIIPYHEQTSGKVATTDYFGEIPKDRISYKDGILLFKADGESRGKLGIPPQRAKTIAGSYDEQNGILTVTTFDVDPKSTYLNQEWNTEKDPFSGDAVNAYNDGPLADGSQMGPFYEIESVSPAAFLEPGGKLGHNHNVFHFTGDKEALEVLSRKIFNISLETVSSAFSK